MIRSHNFSAGPSALPIEVLEKVHQELFDFSGTGASIMEISHRSTTFNSLFQKIETDIRYILQIPENYKALFLQGGATLQFSQVPMNILNGKKKADYVHTGLWSGKAIRSASRYCDVNIVASNEMTGFDNIPLQEEWNLSSDAAYLHYTENETVQGVQFNYTPNSSVPLVCDASSSLLSKPIELNQHGLVYASAQKNIGISGVTIVIINEDLFNMASNSTPEILNYTSLAKANSMINTPATFPLYITGLMLDWLISQGGIAEVHHRNKQKAELLYDTISSSGGFYKNNVIDEFRSISNVPFSTVCSDMDHSFIKTAEQNGFKGLKGHSSTGGLRASIYNSISISEVRDLAEFMNYFMTKNG
ncbi:phosphoserine aminotransferase [Marinobacterium halophilum]|uniref:Phosphoserine aminotransferase n=1 Tax=Marinobacterium halophilum TaxID=267374 RepID=A0A2P8EJQ0_9GAMM|nr:3-phosphoserine/phosphohydroxythreonine transaminase [Marinobacterium halophilum]PSL09641.1 phosphoserine aminotransferase [Marinobacterium halophilum]